MSRKQKIIVSVVGIFIVLLALVGLTYGYFLTRIQGNTNTKSVTVTTADLKLEYGDGNSNIEALKIIPGNTIATKLFTVTNNGNATITDYKVYLEEVQNSFEIKSDVEYTLTCKSYEKYGETGQTENGSCTGVNTPTTFPSIMTVIATNTIEEGITHEYELTVTYENKPYDQSIDMNKFLKAKVNIYDGKIKFLLTEIIKNIKSTETVAYNKTKFIEPIEQDGINYTKPAEQINNENERVMSYTLDDLGTSYYYRGNVSDNYVNYAGMCWRIVRIEGDGSTKLILEDRYAKCNDDIDSDGDATDDYKYTGNWSIGVGNYGYDKSLYENIRMASYLRPNDNKETSMIKTFYNFQTNILNNNIISLRNGKWCLNDVAYEDKTGTTKIDKNTYYELGESEPFYYDSSIRLNYANLNPTLKCNGTIMNRYQTVENVSLENDLLVGALTADEIVYAGFIVGAENQNNYLINEEFKKGTESLMGRNTFLTLSISEYDTFMEFVYGLDYKGNLKDRPVTANVILFRPSIVLKNNILYEKGNGTRTEPYIILNNN